MSALKDQWQTARQARQAAVVQRRQQVQTALQSWQQQRQMSATELRRSLAAFCSELGDETALWLTQAHQQRQSQARRVRLALQSYAQSLRTDVAASLHALESTRTENSRQLRQRLAADHQELQAAVSDLRLAIEQDRLRLQQRVRELQAATAVLRDGHRQQQAAVRSQLLPELRSYVEALQSQVAQTLQAIADHRQQMAIAQRQQRQTDRQAISRDVESLFNDLSEFRQELRQYVWGDGVFAAAVAEALPLKVSPPAAPASKPRKNRRRASAQAVVAPDNLPKASTAPEVPVAESPPVAPAPAPSETLEESIYNYLHRAQGARLSEIEAQLGINRFQAVDALRSLIQKELIVQQDRIYQVQEEVVL